MSAPTKCEFYFNGLCGDCDYCVALLVTRDVLTITTEEWTEIRKRGRYVSGLKPHLRVVKGGNKTGDLA